MNKTLWIINEYAGSPYHGMEFRHYFLARELIKKGFDVSIITASFSHLYSKPPIVKSTFLKEEIDNIKYIWLKVPQYQSAYSKKRVLKWFAFTLKLYLMHKKFNISTPNVIISSSPELFQTISSFKISKNLGAKFIFEVRDIWPFSLIELGNISEKNPFIKLMFKIEKFAYENADAVIGVMPGLKDYLKEKSINAKKIFYIPNGISLEFYKNSENIDSPVMKKIPEDKFIIGYFGTIGSADTLDYLINAVKILENYRDIHILIVGDGAEKNNLINLAKTLGIIDRITFLPPVSKKEVLTLIKKADICYIGWKKRKLYKYGVSANKIFDYMFAEKPILHAYSGKYDIIKEANCGISVEPENSNEISNGILKLYKMNDEQRKKLGNNGKEFLLNNHTFKILGDKLKEILLEKL